MLHSLKIRNFVLVDKAELIFQPAFTAITGETGSGKSILLHALNLVSGERADFSVIGPHEEKCFVEAEFHHIAESVNDLLRENDLDEQNEIVIRREITKSGKSRAFINDTPVSLQVMKLISSQLIEINSQHQTIQLRDPKFQLRILDDLALTNDLLIRYRGIFKDYQSTLKEKENTDAQYKEMLKLADYNAFQLQELEELNLGNNDYELLEQDLLRIEKSDELKQAYGLIHQSFFADELGIESRLKSLRSQISRAIASDETLERLDQRILASLIELNDIAEESQQQLDKLEMDPERKLKLTEQVDRYNHILKKHQKINQAELMTLQSELESSSNDLDAISVKLKDLEKRSKDLHAELIKQSENLSEARKSAAKRIELDVIGKLVDLKMPESRFRFEITKRDQFSENGIDDVQLLFSPNKGMNLNPVQKAASGGELSRLMLVLQGLISKTKSLPTILFDEIDTGVSGDVAQKIGQVLQEMGLNMQLIAITHLPQVAAKAAHHKKVEKFIKENISFTSVKDLDSDERIVEIARLISGELINTTALDHAKALMN